MPYRTLTREDFPICCADDVLVRRQISAHCSKDPLRDVAHSPGVYIQSSSLSSWDQSRGTFAAYYDVRPSKIYKKLTIGVQAAARLITVEAGSALAVVCRANLDQEQIGGRFIVPGPQEARDLLVSFVEFAGVWIDPNWFAASPGIFKPREKRLRPLARTLAPPPARTPIPQGMLESEAMRLLLDRLHEPVVGE